MCFWSKSLSTLLRRSITSGEITRKTACCDSENLYEEQISRLVAEKQDLVWQKEAVQHEKEALKKQHAEAITTLRKQFQAKMIPMEEEKGKHLLVIESKEREVEGLKETFKNLQISKYMLQKKVNEMEHKMQLYNSSKEDYQKRLNEFEKCHAVIMNQFEIIKGAHGKLEKNVVEAIQFNKNLSAINTTQESEINNLKKELKKITSDVIKSKVTYQYKVEEDLSLKAKELDLKILQQKNSLEVDLNGKITEEIARLKEEKQEIMASLQHMQQLLCRQTERNNRIEVELNKLREEYQILERDNEMQRENAKENEQKLASLLNEYKKVQATLKNEVKNISNENQILKAQKDDKYTQTTMKYLNEHEQKENGRNNNLEIDIGINIGKKDSEYFEELGHSVDHLGAGVANEGISESPENINNTIHKEDYLANKEISEEPKEQIKIACEKTANNHMKSEMDSILLPAINTGNLDKYNDISNEEKTSPKHNISANKNIGINIHIDENINNLLLGRALSTENSATGVHEMPSKHFDNYSSELKEVNTKILLLDTQDIHESETGDMKINEVAKDKQINTHTSKDNSEQFTEFLNEEKEREKSLNTMMKKITVEESTKQSCSLLMKTTENLINRNRRLSFNLPVVEEKTEYLDLSRKRQEEIQIMPVSLKERPLSQEMKTAQSSRKIDKIINMPSDVRQETPVSTCSSRTADSLNTGTTNPIPKRNPSAEWNAIANSFYDPFFPTEHATTEILLQPQMKSIQLLLSEVNTATVKGNLHSIEDGNSQNVFMDTQISKTENLLYLEKLCQSRKRKYEYLEKTAISGKMEM
ncbi:coiled-coil domain-containing protein 73 isoform X2 [Crotalus tigris]|uniref:coiled-coil domain-containing protein 73 isoform X2 n=1 Tax=Crotalus tigris TaxID=88082 RepID=UPI00192F9E61|nr:coiled-coil domain-containing protein 73 isoform X2 [Crotalus tigris]